MSINNFLVTGVNPAANETYVPLNKSIVVMFQKHMDTDSLTNSNVKLREVNGPLVNTTISYDGMLREMTITHDGLSPGVQYQLELVGGSSGINSILGEYLGLSQTYEFTTNSEGVSASIEDVIVKVDGPYVSVQWMTQATKPEDRLEFKLSSFPEPESVGVYPVGGFQLAQDMELDIPKRLEEGEYHLHTRLMRDGLVIDSMSKSLLVEKESVETPTSPTEPLPETGFEELKIVESYPKHDAYGVTTSTKIGIRFSEAIDKDAYHESWVTIARTQGDMFETSTASMTLVEDVRPEVLAFEVSGLVENTGYHITVSKEVKGLPGEPVEQMVEGTLIMVSGEARTLGQDATISFATRSEPMYVTVEELKDELGPVADLYSNMELYRRIGYASKAAYEIVSRTRRFDESLFTGGAFPFYMKEYVKYSLAYDMTVQSISAGGNTSGKSIALGDLSVRSEEGSQSTQRDILRALKEKLAPWKDMLHGVSGRGYAGMTSAIDQETGNPYPDFLDGYAEYPELGG